jgi:hypothetical protein
MECLQKESFASSATKSAATLRFAESSPFPQSESPSSTRGENSSSNEYLCSLHCHSNVIY